MDLYHEMNYLELCHNDNQKHQSLDNKYDGFISWNKLLRAQSQWHSNTFIVAKKIFTILKYRA